MGLGGVAIAVLPSVVYPQTVVLGQAGGGDWRLCFFESLRLFFGTMQNK